MSALPTPKIVDLDDPLTPRREEPPAPISTPTTPRRRTAKQQASKKPLPPTKRSTLADDPLVAVFARLPESLSDRLAETVRAVNANRPRRGRVSQQDILGTLVEQYLTPDDVNELSERVDAYRQQISR